MRTYHKYKAENYFNDNKKEYNFLIINPFIKQNDNIKSFLKWHNAIELYNLNNCDTETLGFALAYFYFGSGYSKAEKKYLLGDEDFFKLKILPINEKLKKLPLQLLPFDQKLNLEVFIEIIESLICEDFKVERFFDPPIGIMCKKELILEYNNHICWEIKSIEDDFYLKNIEDDFVTIVSFNHNEKLLNTIEKLKHEIDIFLIKF